MKSFDEFYSLIEEAIASGHKIKDKITIEINPDAGHANDYKTTISLKHISSCHDIVLVSYYYGQCLVGYHATYSGPIGHYDTVSPFVEEWLEEFDKEIQTFLLFNLDKII
tara:strand:- start:16 stop:345 length:330 start_codon:yes stop_codon:yes gene_type:complete